MGVRKVGAFRGAAEEPAVASAHVVRRDAARSASWGARLDASFGSALDALLPDVRSLRGEYLTRSRHATWHADRRRINPAGRRHYGLKSSDLDLFVHWNQRAT